MMRKIFTLLASAAFAFSVNSQVTVTYQVDITAYINAGNVLDATGIRIGGNFTDNGATNASWTPTDPSCEMASLGNNIWSIDITYPTANIGGTQMFKFVNGNWGTNEGIDPANTIVSGGCGEADPGGNVNRTLVIPQTSTVVCYQWDACTGCQAGVNEGIINNVVVSPNPVNDVASFSFELNGANEATISVMNLAGQVVANQTVGNNGQAELDLSTLNAGSYLYTIKAGDAVKTGKLIKK
jgi:hypothetical protein